MPELLPSDRLRPCLLDRLTDEAPTRKTEGREQRVMSMRKYREAVLRDLHWLLNCPNREILPEYQEFSEVMHSVLNFGIPDLAGLTVSSLDANGLQHRLTKAILLCEPRILPDTLRITAVTKSEEMNANALAFQIEGELWAQPFHEMLLIKTDIDLETGEFKVKEVSH